MERLPGVNDVTPASPFQRLIWALVVLYFLKIKNI